jgi:hypothetical protein
MSFSPEHIVLVERDLRAAGRVFDDVPVSGDAWQQNQQRLVANRGRRGRTLLAVAAVVVLVIAVGGWLLGGGPGGQDGMPASGGDDPFGDSVVLGPPVDVETLTISGVETTHQAVLSDQTGKGPSLCDRYVTANNEVGSCTSREPDADKASVAFDWLTGTSGNGDIRGVLAGVDSRAMKVQIWMDNGDMTLADLKPGGWEGTKLFALTVPADGPRPQRLVAYADAIGTVLQAVDLVERFGEKWLPFRGDCSGTGAAVPVPGLDATASGEPGSVDVSMELPGGSARTVCLPMTTVASGATAGPNDVILVVGPEVGGMEVHTKRHFETTFTAPVRVPGTIWSVVTAHDTKDFEAADRLVLFDAQFNPLSSVEAGSLS